VVLYYMAKKTPAIVVAVALAGCLALPAMPSSFWERMDSIVNADEDASGSRAARIRLIEQGMEVFLDNPVTGIGAGQFQNYNAPGMTEKWRVTHNVWLQVAADLGVFGLAIFAFLVLRGYTSNFSALRMLRASRGARNAERGMRTADRMRNEGLRESQAALSPSKGAIRSSRYELTDEDRRILELNAKGMIAAMVGWTVCSLFASVAFNWTFYYVLALAVAGRDIMRSRRVATEAPVAKTARVANLVRATA